MEHYADPAYYTKAYAGRRADVAFYLQLARQRGGPVLECGIGNGRIALPLARAGLEVVGVDLSAPMLADLERQLAVEAEDVRGRVKAVRGDMRTVRLRRRFPLVLAAFNTILHLYTRHDFESFAGTVKRHLAPGGWFVFDWSVPRASELARDPRKTFGAPPMRHPSSGERVRYRERFQYDTLRQVLLVEMQFVPEGGGPAWSVPLTHRQFFPQELEALLHYNGLEVCARFGDFSDEPPDGDVDSMVVVCRSRSSGSESRGGLAKRPAASR